MIRKLLLLASLPLMSAQLISSVATSASAASLYGEQKQSGLESTSFSNNSILISDWFNRDRDNRDRRWERDRRRERDRQWERDHRGERDHQLTGDQTPPVNSAQTSAIPSIFRLLIHGDQNHQENSAQIPLVNSARNLQWHDAQSDWFNRDRDNRDRRWERDRRWGRDRRGEHDQRLERDRQLTREQAPPVNSAQNLQWHGAQTPPVNSAQNLQWHGAQNLQENSAQTPQWNGAQNLQRAYRR